jgi:nucleoside-diphosphate-sugar epimerase
MKVIVFGGAGFIGSAIATELRTHGHQVLTAGRKGCDVTVDFAYDQSSEVYAAIVREADIVVNAAGILIERGGNTFDAVYVKAPTALLAACAAERVARVVHISGLGLANKSGSPVAGKYTAAKLACERAVHQCPVDYAIVRPGLVVGQGSPATALLQWLATLPVIALPGWFKDGGLHPGASLVAPMQVQDVAEAVTRICEHPKALRRTIELAGPEVMTYKTLMQRLRNAANDGAGKGAALWLPVPWWLMKLAALLAAYLPQTVYSIDTMRMLQAGGTTEHNEALYWLRHMPKPAVVQVSTAQAAIKFIAY